MSVNWPQSLPLCILFSAVAGLCLVLSTACLAITKHKENELGKDEDGTPRRLSRRFWYLAYFGNVFFQLASFGAQTISTFVGPVSVAAPLSISAQLLSNVFLFGVVLKYEQLEKDTLVGTLVDTVGVVLLVFVGASFESNEPDILTMLQKTESIVWVSIVLILSGIAFPYHFLLGCSDMSIVTPKRTFVILLVSETFNSVIAASTLKMLALVNGPALLVTIFVTIYANAVLLYASMLRAVAIQRQSIYLPLGVTLYLGMNAITGAIVWEDSIQSIGGYVCVFVLFGLAGFLLSDFELMSSANAQFKYGSVVERGFSLAHSWRQRGTLFSEQIHARKGLSIKEIPEAYERLSLPHNFAARNAQKAIEELRRDGLSKTISLFGSANFKSSKRNDKSDKRSLPEDKDITEKAVDAEENFEKDSKDGTKKTLDDLGDTNGDKNKGNAKENVANDSRDDTSKTKNSLDYDIEENVESASAVRENNAEKDYSEPRCVRFAR